MIHSLKALALAAVTTAGALVATAGAASATTFTAYFQVANQDASHEMIRTSSLPSTITGLINPPAAISPAGTDPASGHAVFSGSVSPGGSLSATVTYDAAANLGTAKCNFTMKVTENSTGTDYLLHYSVDNGICSVPADVHSSNGQFTSQTSQLIWTY